MTNPEGPTRRVSTIRRAFIAPISLIIVVALVIFAFATRHHPDQSPSDNRPHVLSVVVAENFWASIAASIGGRFVDVQSMINNPNVDPHSYEPTAKDARAFAGADIAIVNGVGYDPSATQLLAADTVKNVIDIQDVLHLTGDANPHRWYNPGDVKQVVSRLTTVLSALLPAEHTYFVNQAARFSSRSLATFQMTLREISQKFSGVPVGASESIFAMLSPSLHLRLITPPNFLRAVSEGGDVAPGDIATIDRQITGRAIWVYVYNRQNATPDIQQQVALCQIHHIPVVSITETMWPATTTFAKWQTSQLEHLYSALLIAKAQRAHG